MRTRALKQGSRGEGRDLRQNVAENTNANTVIAFRRLTGDFAGVDQLKVPKLWCQLVSQVVWVEVMEGGRVLKLQM